MRAAALGSEELMRTGWEISILCLLLSWAALWLTDSAENECLFLAFFFPSPLRWPEPFPLDGEALGEGPGVQGPNGAGSELGPGTLVDVGLSISISCLAVSFNWEEGGWGVRFQSSAAHVHNYISSTHTEQEVCLCDLSSPVCTGSFSNQQHNNHHLKQLVQWDALWVTDTHRLVLSNTPTFTVKPLEHEHPCLGEFFLSTLWFHFSSLFKWKWPKLDIHLRWTEENI